MIEAFAPRCLWLSVALGALCACESQSLDGDGSGGAAGASSHTGGAAVGGAGSGSSCSAALRQALVLVDQVTPGEVTLLSRTNGELVVYVDASTGGIGGQDVQPWVYVSLRSGGRVDLTDLEALESTAWDLAFKRSTVRTNSGDSGPGAGGALPVTRAWSALNRDFAAGLALSVERWFDADCTLITDATGAVSTSFAAWSIYDEATHRLAPAPATAFVVRGGDGALYKLTILDYYSKSDGTTGASDGGHYKLRVAPLE